MAYRVTPLVNNEFYHIINRGVEKRRIFLTSNDYQRFLKILDYYQYDGPKPRFSHFNRFNELKYDQNKKLVEIICYCLMPNHFHLLIKQLQDGGISEFMRKVSDSFTRYFNVKQDRKGPLFEGAFKSVRIESDEQFIHVSRYIHLNPLVSFLVKDIDNYIWSSYPDFVGKRGDKLCQTDPVLSFFKSQEDYQQFVLDQEDYGKSLEFVKHHLQDE